jgi:Flp pilus assembly protein TadD
MAQFYAQSWLLVHYFFSTPERQASIRRYLVEARQGDGAAALQRATGLTPAQLNDELRRYIRGGQIRYRRLTLDERQAAPPVTVARLPASANDLLLYEAALRAGINDERGPDYLQRIRAAAGRHPGDPLAARVLAHAEALFGEGAAADRLLEPLIAAAPNDAELLYIRGMRHLTAAEKGDWETESRAARTWFTRAHRADENHYQTLYRYGQSLRGDRAFLSENNANVMLLAHQLAPQVSEIRMNAAMLLISRRDFAQAEALLRPLAADPHDSGLADAARRLLEQAQAQSGASSEPAPGSN